MRILSGVLAAVFAVTLTAFAAAEDKSKDKITVVVDLKNATCKSVADNPELVNYNEGEEKLFFYTNGTAEMEVKVPADGEYNVIVRASCDKAEDNLAKFKLSVDGKEIGKETTLTTDDAKDYTISLGKLKSGERKLVIEFTNDMHKEGEYDLNLYVHAVTLKKK